MTGSNLNVQFTGQQLGKLSDAVLDAYDYNSLAQVLLFRLNKHLGVIAGPGNLSKVVFDLITTANREGWAGSLLVELRNGVPGNPRLYAFAQDFGLTSMVAKRDALEIIIDESESAFDPDAFRKGLGAQEPRVARIEIPTNEGMAYGSGFLVGTRTLMTNHHVVRPLLDPAFRLQADPSKVRVRFDYKVIANSGGAVQGQSAGRICDLDTKWHVVSSPNATEDRAPRADELDFAIIRLAEAAADDQLIGGEYKEKRGFIPFSDPFPPLGKGATVFILQHMKAGPLKLTLKTKSVEGTFDSGTRVRYTTNTEPGSSGSPCFGPNWKLAAVHHSGDPDWEEGKPPTFNQGIPAAAIHEYLKHQGKLSALGEEKD